MRKLVSVSLPFEGNSHDHACAESWLPLGGLPEGVWPPQDDLQSLCALERAGIWQKIFESVAASAEPPEQAWWWASAIAGLSLRPG